MTTQQLERQPATQKSPVPKPVITFFAILRRIFNGPEAERECVYEPEEAHIGTWKIRLSVTPDEIDGGFVAECLDLPGAVAQGETKSEALENLVDAVQGVVAAKMDESVRAIGDDGLPGTMSMTVTL
jgi:predicted RNase H-like HicB family nuclease